MEGEKIVSKNHEYGHTLLRVTIGLLFFVMGTNKLMNPEGIIGMLGNIGFPFPLFFGWILILSEVIFGASIFLGYKLKYATWPLAIVLAIAALTVVIPNEGLNSPNFLFHLIGIAGLISLALTGPGKFTFNVAFIE